MHRHPVLQKRAKQHPPTIKTPPTACTNLQQLKLRLQIKQAVLRRSKIPRSQSLNLINTSPQKLLRHIQVNRLHIHQQVCNSI